MNGNYYLDFDKYIFPDAVKSNVGFAGTVTVIEIDAAAFFVTFRIDAPYSQFAIKRLTVPFIFPAKIKLRSTIAIWVLLRDLSICLQSTSVKVDNSLFSLNQALFASLQVNISQTIPTHIPRSSD